MGKTKRPSAGYDTLRQRLSFGMTLRSGRRLAPSVGCSLQLQEQQTVVAGLLEPNKSGHNCNSDNESRRRGTKRSRSEDDEDRQDMCSKRFRKDCDSYLSVYVHTPSVTVSSPPRLPRQRTLVLEGRTIPVVVCGMACRALVDSGTAYTDISMELFDKLPLSWKERKAKKITITASTWTGVDRHEGYVVEDFKITLKNGMVLTSDALVWSPNELPNEEVSLIIGLQLLHKYGVMERISGKTGIRSLHFQDFKPRGPTKPPRRRLEGNQIGMKVHAHRNRRDRARFMAIDTGAFRVLTGIFPRSKCPSMIDINLGRSACISGEVEYVEVDKTIYTMGINLLYEHEAVIDYGACDLYLLVNGVTYKIKMYSFQL